VPTPQPTPVPTPVPTPSPPTPLLRTVTVSFVNPTFAPLPADVETAANYSVVAPAGATSAGQVPGEPPAFPAAPMWQVRSDLLQGVAAPTIVVAVALPSPGVGILFARTPLTVEDALLDERALGTLTLRTTNRTTAAEFLRTLGLALNPDVQDTGLVSRLGFRVVLTAAASPLALDRSFRPLADAAWAFTFPSIASLVINRGPAKLPSGVANCSFSPLRGRVFVENFERVFSHPLGLPLDINVVPRGGAVQLPPTVSFWANRSGFVGVRGTLRQDDPMRYAIVASDTFFEVSVSCAITPRIVPLHVIRTAPLVETVKAGAPFRLLIPQTEIFAASDPFEVRAVTRPDGSPLPATLSFTPPNNLHGFLPWGVTQLVIVASTDRTDARFAFSINATNVAPRTVGAWPPVLCRSGALLVHRVRIDSVFADADDEAMRCAVEHSSALPPWFSAAVDENGLELAVRSNGPVPTSAHGANFTVSVNCTDGLGSVVAELRVVVGHSVPPNATRPVPTIIVTAGESETQTILVSDYWTDADGDPFGFSGSPVVSPASAVSWLKAAYADRYQRLELSLTPTTEDEGITVVNVTVADHFGNATTGSVQVQVVLTLVQKLTWLWNGLSTVGSVFLSALGMYWILPLLHNTLRSRSLQKPCPLYEQESFQLHERTSTVEFLCPGPVSRGRACFARFACCSDYLQTSAHMVPLPAGDPPPWIEVHGRFIHRVGTAENCGVRHCVIREFSQYGFLLAEFNVSFDELHLRIGAEMAEADAAGAIDDAFGDLLGIESSPAAGTGVDAGLLKQLEDRLLARHDAAQHAVLARQDAQDALLHDILKAMRATGGPRGQTCVPVAAAPVEALQRCASAHDTILTNLRTSRQRVSIPDEEEDGDEELLPLKRRLSSRSRML